MSAHDPSATAAASTSDADALPRPLGGGFEEAAARARIAARLFGAGPAAVRIGRYEVGELIGAGGMGVIYSARDPELGRMVALKVLTAQYGGDERQRQRLIGEAQALARLSHPNVVQIYEVGEHDGVTFLALELIQGETLATWQRRPGLRWAEILAAYVDAARGLAAAHAVGVVHRDVKPSNILLGVDGRVRVVDFGLARAAPDDPRTIEHNISHPAATSTTGTVAGTPAYMSPEQAAGRGVDERSDVFSLCVSLFEGLYGRRPFEAQALSGLVERGQLAPTQLRARPSAVPTWVLPILAAGLEPDVARRTSDLCAFIAALEQTPRRRRRRAWVAGAVLGLGLGGWGVRVATVGLPVCPAIAETIEGVWDPARRAAIHAQFVASGLPYAEDAWRQAERSLDAAVFAWSRERRLSCLRTYVDRKQSAERFDLAAACLEDHEKALRDRIGHLAAAGSAEVTRAHVIVRELGDPSVCTDTEALRRGPAPPAAAVRDQVAELRRELEAIRILAAVANFAEAETRAAALSVAAEVYGPLHAEAVYVRGVVAARRGAVDEADRWFTSAAAEAEELRDDHLAATIAGERTELAVLGQRDPARARVHADLYGAKLRRIDASSLRRAEYLDRMGELELMAGKPAVALAHHEEASRLHASNDLVGRARNLQGTANALARLGRTVESIERLQTARDLVATELGEAQPETAVASYNLAVSLQERHVVAIALDPNVGTGDLMPAIDLLRGALAIETSHGDPVRAARTRIALALVLLTVGEVDPAFAELERALPVVQKQLPPTHPDVVNALRVALNIHLERGAWGPAADACISLIEVHRARGEPIPFELLLNAGEFTLRRGDALAAITWYDQALSAVAAEDPPDPSHLVHALNGRAKVYLVHGDPTLARALLERARPLLERVEPPSAWLAAEVLWNSAQALVATGGGQDEARRLAIDARAKFLAEDPRSSELAAIDAFLARRGER